MVNAFMTIQPSRLADRQPQVISGQQSQQLEPQRLSDSVQRDSLQRERARQISAGVFHDYERFRQDAESYEEKLLGREKDFTIDPNVEVDISEYEMMEDEFQQEVSPYEARLAAQSARIDRGSQRLQRLGVRVDVSPISEAKESLSDFAAETRMARLGFVTDIAQEQQADIRLYEEKLAQVDLSPALIQRQEQLIGVAQTNPDLFSKPYIYDRWVQEKQLKEGMTALGYSVADLRSMEGSRVEFWDDGAIKRISAPVQEFAPVKASRGGVGKGEFTPYVVDFDSSGQIVREQKFAPMPQITSTWQGGYLFTSNIQLAKEVVFEGGQVKQAQAFAAMTRSASMSPGSAFISYQPFTQKVTKFDEGRISDQAIFQEFRAVDQRSVRGDPGNWSAYQSGGTFLAETRDYKGGLITVQPKPITLQQRSGYVYRQPTQQVNWQNPFTGKGNF